MINEYINIMCIGEKYLFYFFYTLVFLEWFEEVVHVGFFETRL